MGQERLIDYSLALKYGGYFTEQLTPLALLFLIVMGILIFFLPRKRAALPIILLLLFIPLYQRIIILGLDFILIRILIILGLIRIFIKGEYRQINPTILDYTVFGWIIATVILYTMLYGSFGALINRTGFLLETLGIYICFRTFIRTIPEIQNLFKVVILTAIVVAGLMVMEQVAGKNYLSVFGALEGVNIRDGKIRSTAAFLHPIMAGVFGATLFPVSFSLIFQEKKWYGIIGVCTSVTIAITSASSGAILGLAVGIITVMLWQFSKYVRIAKFAVIPLIIILQILMQAPVWALLARVKVFGASTGYHRFYLFDQFIRRFPEWALMGTPTTATWDSWGKLWDTTNMYVSQGTQAGIIGLSLFIAMIVLAFKYTGEALTRVNSPAKRVFIWAIGATFFVHLTLFFGSNYFDQTVFFLLLHFSMVSLVKERLTAASSSNILSYIQFRLRNELRTN